MNQIPEQLKLKNTIKYPTSIIVGGISALGFELADILIEQGGYVILIDTFTPENIEKLRIFPKDTLISFLDYSSVPHLSEDIRRLDYVFYFNHNSKNLVSQISTQEFLQASNTLDYILSLAHSYDAKFLLTTSIKAQQLFSSADLLNLKLASSGSTAYTEMEFQRYAENLTQEYHEKKQLNTRIVRFGEMIGEHIDFSVDSAFTELIISAAHEKPLKLYKDGLEAEWYVHTLDASYGIIKAQFSKDTNGQVFSVCYENPITHLSIAYKIQEYADYPAEIVFVDEKDNLPRLAPYKPAPNLQQIGWKPKISFDKAVHQSLLAAKVFIAGNKKIGSKGDGIINKLHQVIIGNNKDELESENALSRLIAERNRQEELKKQRIELAHAITKKKRAHKPRTMKERLINQLWNQYRSLSGIFTFLKNRTLLEIFLLFILFFLFSITYIGFIGPVILLGKEIYNLKTNYSGLKTALEEEDFRVVFDKSNKIESNLESINNAANFVKPFLGLMSLGEISDSTIVTVDIYKEYVDGIRDISYFMIPLQEYLENYQDNTQKRLSSDVYISLLNDGINHEDTILEFESRIPFVESGIQKLQNVKPKIPIKRQGLPKSIQDELTQIDFELLNYSNEVEKLSNYQYLPDLLGINNQTTILFFFVDNSIPRSIGGEISSVGIITMQNGSISFIDVKTPQSIDVSESMIDDFLIEDINKYRFAPIQKSDFVLEDLATIGDFDSFVFHTKNLFSDIYNLDISGVVVFPLEDFDNLRDLVLNTNEDLLQKHKNDSLVVKNQSVSQEVAKVIHEFSAGMSDKFFLVSQFFSQNAQNGNIYASFDKNGILKLIKDNNLDNSKRENIAQSFEIYVNTNDSTRASGTFYKSSVYNLRYIVSRDGITTYELGVQPQLEFSSQDWIICIPKTSIISPINLTLSTGQNFKSTDINGKSCRIINTVNNNPFMVTWGLDFPILEKNSIKYDFLLPSILGQTVQVDAELIFDEVFSNVKTTPELIKTKNSFIFTNELARDSIYLLELEKN
jgi:nucleoside-diphosphate-sugar epimerase